MLGTSRLPFSSANRAPILAPMGVRLAMSDPRDRGPRRPWQFSIKTLMLLPVILTFFVFLLSMQHTYGVGHTTITLHFVVLDEATSVPIPGSVVALYNPDALSILEKAETST